MRSLRIIQENKEWKYNTELRLGAEESDTNNLMNFLSQHLGFEIKRADRTLR